jgi:CBS domain-containing protein
MLAGILSERDYARKVILKGKASKNTPVKEIMTPEVITVRLQQTVAECQAIMGRYRIRHLPVLDGKKVVGIISIGDVVQVMLAEQEEALRRMEQFALGDSLTE